MAVALRYATDSQEIPLGYFLDSSDGNTEETALSIANTDIKLWKNGATTLADKNSGGATHISNGIYYCTLDATDTNTLGPLIIFCHPSGALPVRVECVVLPAVVYDSLIAGSDNLQVDVTQISGTAVSTSSAQLGVNVVNWKGSSAPDMTGDAYAVVNNGTYGNSAIKSQLDTVQGYVDELETRLTSTRAGYLDNLTNLDTAVSSRLASADYTAPDNTSISAIKAKTDNLPSDPASQSSVETAITNAHATTDAKIDAVDDYVDTEVAAIKAVTDKLDTAMELDGAVYRFTENALEMAPTGSGASAGEIADAVWDEALSEHATAGSAGAALAAAGSAGDPWSTSLPGAYGTGTAGHILGNIASTIETECGDALATYDPPTNAEMDAAIDALPTAAEIRTEIDTNSTELAAIKGYVDELESRLTSTRAGYLDNLTNLDATVSSRLAAADYTAPDNTSISAIKAQTDQLNFVGTDVKATLDGETVTVGTNNDKTGYSLTADYDAAKTAAQPGDGMDLVDSPNTNALNAIAERKLVYDWTAITSEVPDRCELQAMRRVRNRVVATEYAMTVYEEDDTTVAWQAALTTDPDAEPITEIDPTS